MENTVHEKNKNSKSSSKNGAANSSTRIKTETKKYMKSVLQKANSKKYGRKIKAEELIDLAIRLVNEDHIKQLQEKSLTNKDKKTFLYQKYIEKFGQISEDEFIGFMMTSEFHAFANEHMAKAA